MTDHGKVFGTWDAPMTDDDIPVPAPVGRHCIWCEEAIKADDNGRISPQGHVEHRECSLRAVMGGIGHMVDHDRYCQGEEGPDAGLSTRTSSLLVWRFWQETRGRPPTHEQRSEWQTIVELERGAA